MGWFLVLGIVLIALGGYRQAIDNELLFIDFNDSKSERIRLQPRIIPVHQLSFLSRNFLREQIKVAARDAETEI